MRLSAGMSTRSTRSSREREGRIYFSTIQCENVPFTSLSDLYFAAFRCEKYLTNTVSEVWKLNECVYSPRLSTRTLKASYLLSLLTSQFHTVIYSPNISERKIFQEPTRVKVHSSVIDPSRRCFWQINIVY